MVEQARNGRDSGCSYGGMLPHSGGQHAFELTQRKPAPIPVVIAVPHAGRTYPSDLIERMRFPGEACLRLEDRLADLVAREVVKTTGASLLISHAPRAMIDLNRSPDDMDWEMIAEGVPPGVTRYAAGRRARSGLGLVPRRLPGIGELWKRRMTLEDLEARIELIHRPYHSTLSQVLANLRDRWGAALLVDLHSMPPLGSKIGSDPSPDFVIGDRYGSSCDGNLSMAALDHFEKAGRRAAHNRPYAGGYVLDRHSAPARGLHAMQIEICRTSYLDPALRQAGDGLEEVASLLAELVRGLAEELIAGSRSIPQAAE